jgi:hypothetical protein
MASASSDREWFIVGRWQQYEGELRANVLRLAGIGAFYLIELVNYFGLRLGPLEMPAVVSREFHLTVTALAVAWALVGLTVLLCLSHRIFPAGMKFASSGCDLVLLTAVLVVADGPKSPLVVGYFLLIALATLRFDLRLVQVTTLGAMAGYLFLLGYAKWFADRDLRVPRYHQAIMLVALALTGIVLGQVIRRVRRLAEEYAAETANPKEAQA